MTKARLEAFSDGVMAILITIMVLELKVPHDPTLEGLKPLLPVLLCYALSFVMVGIYWNNHHHLLHAMPNMSGGVMWANHHLLFWLSLVPFATAWMGENHFEPLPTAMYGATLVMCAVAWQILEGIIVRQAGPTSTFSRTIKGRWKTWLSAAFYVLGIGLAFVKPAITYGLYVAVAAVWLVPDRQLARAAAKHQA